MTVRRQAVSYDFDDENLRLGLTYTADAMRAAALRLYPPGAKRFPGGLVGLWMQSRLPPSAIFERELARLPGMALLGAVRRIGRLGQPHLGSLSLAGLLDSLPDPATPAEVEMLPRAAASLRKAHVDTGRLLLESPDLVEPYVRRKGVAFQALRERYRRVSDGLGEPGSDTRFLELLGVHEPEPETLRWLAALAYGLIGVDPPGPCHVGIDGVDVGPWNPDKALEYPLGPCRVSVQAKDYGLLSASIEVGPAPAVTRVRFPERP